MVLLGPKRCNSLKLWTPLVTQILVRNLLATADPPDLGPPLRYPSGQTDPPSYALQSSFFFRSFNAHVSDQLNLTKQQNHETGEAIEAPRSFDLRADLGQHYQRKLAGHARSMILIAQDFIAHYCMEDERGFFTKEVDDSHE